MAAPDLLTPTGIDSVLHVDRFGLTVGRVSVGLPMSCTNDMVLLRYVDLINLVQPKPAFSFAPPDADIAALAAVVNASPAVVRARLQTLAG